MDISGFLVPNLGLGGIVVLVVLLILRGDLIPKSAADGRSTDKDRQIQEWRDAYLREREHREIGQRQVETLLQMAHTTTAVVDAVAAAAGVARGGEVREVEAAPEERRL
jgi:hypothetical protein